MSDNLTDNSSEAQRRAEKIKSIRRSIHGEAEAAPMTCDNETIDSERLETIADRIARAKKKKDSAVGDILGGFDEAEENEKAEAEKNAVDEAAEAEEKYVEATPDISDIIIVAESPAQEELSRIADEITEDFSEVSSDVEGEVMDFTETGDAETDNAEAAETDSEAEETEEPLPVTNGLIEDISSIGNSAEDTIVFTPVSHTAVSEDETSADKAETPIEENIKEEIPLPPTDGERADKPKKNKKKKTFKQRVLGLFPQKGDGVGECIRKVVFLISIAAICVCGFIVGDYYFELWASRKKTEDLMEIYEIYDEPAPRRETVVDEGEKRKKYTGMLDSARKLYEQNSDIVGVITIPDTPVNYPVMQSEDNSKYLDRKFDLSENRTGEIFLDYRNHFDDVGEDGYLKYPNSGNLVMYGHNMLDEQMFGSLKYYQWKENYYGEHPIIYLNSNYEKYTYKIFAFFVLDAEDQTDTKFDCWNTLDFSGENDFYDFVNEAKRRSLRLNDVDVRYGDSLITLSTCNTTLPDEERGRLIIMARQLREGEDLLEGTQNSTANPNIKWPSIYYDAHPGVRYDPDAEFVPYGPSEADE